MTWRGLPCQVRLGVLVILMARKRRRKSKNRRNFVAIPFSQAVALSTLADETVLKTGLAQSMGEDIFVISVDLSIHIKDNTTGEFPLFFGISHGDYTVAEILEAVNAEQTDPDDKIAMEHGRRQVRKIGGIHGTEALGVQFNDGKTIRQKIGFSVGDGHTLDFWVKNQSGGALTTGAVIELDGVIYGRWQR